MQDQRTMRLQLGPATPEGFAAPGSPCVSQVSGFHDAITGTVNYAALRALYDLLLDRAPSIGVAVGRAAMLLEAGDVDAATLALSALLEADVVNYQPYWVTRARLAELRDDAPALRQALERALGLTEDAAVRQFLADWLERRDESES